MFLFLTSAVNGSTTNTLAPILFTNTKLAECVIAREKDFGMNDIQFSCVTHLGPVLHAGDLVLGYDLTNTNLNIDEAGEKSFQKIAKNIPDVVLVRKVRKKSIHFIYLLIFELICFLFLLFLVLRTQR
jgi:hypothetical protein